MRAMMYSMVLCALSLVLSGCQYERVVSQRNILSGVQGAQSGIPSKKRTNTKPAIFAVPEGGIRQVDDRGNVTLYTKSFRHLMSHLAHAIQNDERELFVEQILSKVTRDEFVERDLDPGLAFDELVLRQQDIFRLFHFMPMGEYTPGITVEPLGMQTFRIAVDPGLHRDLRWTGIDAVFEDGNYRLRWFVGR